MSPTYYTKRPKPYTKHFRLRELLKRCIPRRNISGRLNNKNNNRAKRPDGSGRVSFRFIDPQRLSVCLISSLTLLTYFFGLVAGRMLIKGIYKGNVYRSRFFKAGYRMRASTRFVGKKFASCVGLQESRKETKQMSTIRYDGGFLLYFCSLFFLFYSFFAARYTV